MTEDELRNDIDGYSTSIHAIVGFANFYLWDPKAKSDRSGVTVFQGRRLMPTKPSNESDKSSVAAFQTPDLGVLLPDNTGVLAEVKLSFPKEQAHWMDDFEQLMRYDTDLAGWPSDDGKVKQHDVVLITEQGRARRVQKFYDTYAGNKIQFVRPFAIVSINRSDNRQPYYFFQRVHGTLSQSSLDTALDEGVKVPMKVFLEKYSTVKLYDAVPPLPYMMELIWTHVVVDAARQQSRFAKLHKGHKLPVVLNLDDVVEKLRLEFSFQSIDAHVTDGSPLIPTRAWVVNAFEQYVSIKQAEWIDAAKKEVRVYFQRLPDPLSHFITGCCRTSNEEVGGSPAPSDLQRRLPFEDD